MSFGLLQLSGSMSRIRAVYYALPEQWCMGAQVESGLVEELRSLANPEAVILPTLVTLAIALAKERLEHASVMSTPVALLPVSFGDVQVDEDNANGAMALKRRACAVGPGNGNCVSG